MATIHDEFADLVYTIQRKSGGLATVKIYWRCDIDPCATYEIPSKGALAYAREMIKRLENEPVPDGLHDRALQAAKSCRALGCDAAAAEMEEFASRHAPNSDPIEIVRTEGNEMTKIRYFINETAAHRACAVKNDQLTDSERKLGHRYEVASRKGSFILIYK